MLRQEKRPALCSMGCVVLYLDNHLSAFRVRGDDSLRNELREKGIRHGTNFGRDTVGVFVANQAAEQPNKLFCRVGEENYFSLFSDYVCFAHSDCEEYRGFHGVILIIAPKHRYDRQMRTMVEFILSEYELTNHVSYPFNEKKFSALSALLYNSQDCIMVLDDDGNVVFTSAEFEKEFGFFVDKGPFPHISMFMSELVFTAQYIKKGTTQITRELLLTNKEGESRFYVCDFQRLEDHGNVFGLRCSFQPLAQKKRVSGKQFGQKVIYDFDSIKGCDPKMLKLKQLAKQASTNRSNVLIQGESGTGKELMAQAIHSADTEHSGAFVPINCAALTPELLSSELFGYEDGAFTGAIKGGRAGKFEQADGGTIFLDEISEMPLNMQSSLLRVLEDGVVSRVGGNRYIPLDVRVIAATNKDLWECVSSGSFRADLYFRLNIVKINIPPLRERPGDIPLMMRHMLSKFVSSNRCSIKDFSPEILVLFKNYSWPGNIREVRNIIERCASSVQEEILTMDNLPDDIMNLMQNGRLKPVVPSLSDMSSNLDFTPGSWKQHDKSRIAALMETHNGNKSKVAQELGISRGTLYKKLREYGWES